MTCHDEHLYASVLRGTGGLNARLPVSSNLYTLSKELPTRDVEERQHLLEQVLRRHALRVGLCVFQQIFEVLVVDRFLQLLGATKGSMSCLRPLACLHLKSHRHFDARGLQPSLSDSQRPVMRLTSQQTPMFTIEKTNGYARFFS